MKFSKEQYNIKRDVVYNVCVSLVVMATKAQCVWDVDGAVGITVTNKSC